MTETAPEKTRGPQPIEPPPGAEILRLEEAAWLMGRISPRSVRRLIEKGQLKALDVIPGGSALRVRRQEVINHLNGVEFVKRQGSSEDDPERPTKPAPKPRPDDGHDPLRDGPRKKFKTSL